MGDVGYGGWTSAAIILVLFILLVIVLRGFVY
ncbi:YjcZ family sporulation protein [Paenibacillus sp. NPDC056579]|nr:YjcZ family sporulation protein [Paenibacillus sp. H1-7]